jgi:haloacetate dehalogenase
MIGGNPRDYLHAKLGGWGSGGWATSSRRRWPNTSAASAPAPDDGALPPAIHTACEDYRASAGIDLEHDRASRARGDKMACDTLVLWGAHGVVQRLFDPLSLWQAQCSGAVTGWAMPAGHFIPEQLPEETATALRAFMAGNTLAFTNSRTSVRCTPRLV